MTTVNVNAYLLEDYLLTRIHVTGLSPNHAINIGLLIDTSESMEQERLAAVKQTLHAMCPLLRSGDLITLISFNDDAKLLLNHLLLTDDGEQMVEFRNAIESLAARGCTNLSAGFETLLAAGADFDAIVMLTDGQVNSGLTSLAGLRTMALTCASGRPIHSLGYGADHNRGLLRDLATKSSGSYSYIDSDEILPVAIGDIVTGLRTELIRRCTLEPSPAAWISQEAGGWQVGSLVADRDYWVVARRHEASWSHIVEADVSVALYTDEGRTQVAVHPLAEDDVETHNLLREQIMRVRTAALLFQLSDALENGRSAAYMAQQIAALKTEIQAMPMRPLLLRMLGQLSEAEELIQNGPTTTPLIVRMVKIPQAPTDAHLLARMASGYTILSQQRGTASRTAAEEDAGQQAAIFSSPAQIQSSHNTLITFQNHRHH